MLTFPLGSSRGVVASVRRTRWERCRGCGWSRSICSRSTYLLDDEGDVVSLDDALDRLELVATRSTRNGCHRGRPRLPARVLFGSRPKDRAA
jgi:hypothetical protein